ncbi:MAG TPA: flagellar motor protein MotA [Thermopetrobacter sp.]|nr:flagellar motor protein MotA [Thermopetrobacter sp.]
MDAPIETDPVSQPRIHLIRMVVFVLLVAIIAAVLFNPIKTAFMANPALNGLILFVLLAGIVYTFGMVIRLFREVSWVNHFRITEPGLELPYTPRLLGPMAALLRGHQPGALLTPFSLRSLLDSLAARLDESRDIARYLTGLLIFLGLLGTFWGLLQTIHAVGDVIRNLNVAGAKSATVFEELKAGLEAPLAGMGTSFSSSLFGLAGALVLGFLDLQAAQAQNRFYNEVEDWLASITDIAGGGAALDDDGVTALQAGIAHLDARLQSIAAGQAQPDAAMRELAQALSGVVRQMREEQQIMRQILDQQIKEQAGIRDILTRLTDKG